eukprot:CAMPEP_0172648082 /NCGR_PEP_ID=MMETSP1068-20121228/241086_1 /TAXON_ID=35684 /ORGANISM="Pseudopedinella elastica, Strain CCMP716" /LENGTH=110 /DNA_ID=CAMNT_0013462387 /DNA_START=438 /DNA_END=767 /DNA_ORIENTATION=+
MKRTVRADACELGATSPRKRAYVHYEASTRGLGAEGALSYVHGALSFGCLWSQGQKVLTSPSLAGYSRNCAAEEFGVLFHDGYLSPSPPKKSYTHPSRGNRQDSRNEFPA